MAKDDSQPERPNRDLDDSIDALLSEIDASCSRAEDPSPPDLASQGAAEQEEETTFEMVEDEQQDAPADGGPQAPAPETEPEIADAPAGEDALTALDAVSGGAQSLIEDAIGDLLEGDAPEAHEETAAEPDERSGEHAPEAEAGQAAALNDDDLLAQIADELSTPEDVESLVEEVEEMLGEGSSPDPEPDPGDAPEALDEEIEPRTEAETETDAEADAETPSKPATEPGSVAATSGEPGSVDALDETLAGMDDELLMGDFETPDGELVESAGMDGSIDPVMLLDRLGIDEQEAEEDPGKPGGAVAQDATVAPDRVEPNIPAADAGDTVSAAEAAQTRGAAVRAAPSKPIRPRTGDEGGGSGLVADEDVVESIWQTAWRLGRTHGGRAWVLARDRGGPMAARVILRVSAPVKNRPAVVRDSIGYIALWTLLLATVLWFYVAFIRTTPAPVPAQAPTRVMTPGETSDAVAAGQRP